MKKLFYHVNPDPKDGSARTLTVHTAKGHLVTQAHDDHDESNSVGAVVSTLKVLEMMGFLKLEKR